MDNSATEQLGKLLCDAIEARLRLVVSDGGKTVMCHLPDTDQSTRRELEAQLRRFGPVLKSLFQGDPLGLPDGFRQMILEISTVEEQAER